MVKKCSLSTPSGTPWWLASEAFNGVNKNWRNQLRDVNGGRCEFSELEAKARPCVDVDAAQQNTVATGLLAYGDCARAKLTFHS